MQSRWQEKLWQCSVLVSYHVAFYNIMCYFVWCRHVCQEMNIAKRRTPGMLSELRIDVVSVLLLVLLSVPYTTCFHGLAHFTCRNKGEHRSFFPQMWNYVDTHRYHASSTHTRPCRRLHSAIWQHIGLHFVTLRCVTLHGITWPWQHIACHWIALHSLHTYVILRACTHAEDTF